MPLIGCGVVTAAVVQPRYISLGFLTRKERLL
jgi:hypothetical protein